MDRKAFKTKVFNTLANNINENDPMFNVTYFISDGKDSTIGCIALASTNRFDCREIHAVMWQGGYHEIFPLYDEDAFGCRCTNTTSDDLYDALCKLPHNVPAMDLNKADGFTCAFAVTDYFNGEIEQDQITYLTLAEDFIEQIKEKVDENEPTPSLPLVAARLMELHDRSKMSFTCFQDAIFASLNLASILCTDKD